MFAEYAPRLLRQQWSALGLSHLTGKSEPSPQDMMMAIQGLGTALDQFVQELATMLQRPVDLHQRASLIIEDAGIINDEGESQVPVIDLTGLEIDGSNFRDYYASGYTVNNQGSVNTADNTVEGGFAQIFVGPVYMDSIVGSGGPVSTTPASLTVVTGITAGGDLATTTIQGLFQVTGTGSIATAELDAVDNVLWSVPNLQQRKRTATKVLKAGTLGAYANIDTAETC